MRSCRDCRDLSEISPWCLLDSKFRRDCGEISSISPRLPRTRQDCRDRAKIVEISPWRSWHSKSRRDRGEISSILPKFVETSPWCLRSQQMSWWDLSDLAMIFVGFSNLVGVCGEIFYISPRLARSRREIRLFLYLAKILKDTNFLPRLPKYNPIIPRWNE